MSLIPYQLEEMINQLPTLPGVYALILILDTPARLSIGRLVEKDIAPGTYVYFGSARGPGGVHARLGRHLRGTGKTHWHVDHLRAAARATGLCWAAPDDDQPWECRWFQLAVEQSGVSIPVRRFGASDCRAGCAAHLLYLEDITLPDLQSVLQAGMPGKVHCLKLPGVL